MTTATPSEVPIAEPGRPGADLDASAAKRRQRAWRIARYAFAIAALGAAVYAVSGKTGEFNGASQDLAGMNWAWVVVAIAAEALSYLAYSALQRRLLAAGETQSRMLPMTGVSLASNAMQNSLPGGAAFAAAYMFRAYRRFGADDVLAAWTVVAVNGLSFVALSAMAAAGLILAFGNGSALDLVSAIIGIAIFAAVLVTLWVERSRLLPHVTKAIRAAHRLSRRPQRRPAEEVFNTVMERLSAITPKRSDWAWGTALAASNWAADSACLTIAFIAIGKGVPWRGLLLAYGAGQLAAILPITPGGLGVVESSLTVALVNFSGPNSTESTVAAVLLYRLISFWAVLPIGWGSWGALALAKRTRRHPSGVAA